MFLILEGPDGGGKSTLAEALESRGWEVAKFGPPDLSPVSYYMGGFQAAEKRGDNIVCDRAHVSSLAYGLVFRGLDDLSPWQRWYLDGWLMSRNAVMVYAAPPKETTDRVIAERPARDADALEFEVPDKQAKVREVFDHYFEHMCPHPVLGYDFTRPGDYDRVLAEVESLSHFYADVQFPLRASQAYGNRYSPGLCLVGADPSEELFRALVGASVDSEPGQELTLNKVCIVPDLPRGFAPGENWISTAFVAVGDKAANDLADAGIAYTALPHVKTVSFRDLARYGRAIAGVEKWQDYATLAQKGFITRV